MREIVDKYKLGIFRSFRNNFELEFVQKSISLLPQRERRRLQKLIPISIILSVVELFGVMSLAASGSLIVKNISQAGRPTRVELFFEQELKIEISLSSLTLLLISFSMLLLLARIAIGAFFSYRLLTLYSILETKISAIALRVLLYEDFEKVSTRTSGEALSAVVTGSSRIVIGVIQSLMNMITDFTSVLLIGFLFILATPQVALTVMCVLATARLITKKWISTRSKRLSQNLFSLQTSLNESVITTIDASREIRTYNLEERILKTFINAREEFALKFLKSNFLNTVYRYFLEIFVLASACLVFIMETITADLRRAVSSLVLFLVGALRLIPALQRLQASILSINLAKGMTSGFFELVKGKQQSHLRESVSPSKKINLTSAPKIQMSHVHFYPNLNPKHMILSDINFSLPTNKVLCVIGSSGSGKSTLLDLMCGLISPKSGKIELLDEKGLSLNPQSVNISYCSQFPFIDSTSLLENVLQTNESFSQIVLQILEQLGLERFLDNQTWSNQFRKLSGGEKQRIGIARALLNSSHFVVLDEPTSALDSNARNRVHALIKQIRNSTTIVLASHDSALINLSDYVLCLEHGEQVFFGPTSEYYSSKLTK